MEPRDTTFAVQRYLDELAGAQSPTEPIIRAVLARSVDRLRLLCSVMLHRSYPRLARGPAYLEADDIVGAVVERLLKAMRDVRPETVRQFFALANRHLRWELNDLARRLDQQGPIVSLGSIDAPQPSIPSESGDGVTLQRILGAIDALPEDEREVLDLVRLQAMTHAEVAALLGVAEKTVQRRLRRGVMLLSEALGDLMPAATVADAVAKDDAAPNSLGRHN